MKEDPDLTTSCCFVSVLRTFPNTITICRVGQTELIKPITRERLGRITYTLDYV